MKMEENEFKLVSYKRKPSISKKNYEKNNVLSLEETTVNEKVIIKRIEDYRNELSTTDFYDSFQASLVQALNAINDPKINKLICIGLGKVSQQTSSKFQLALVLCLKDKYEIDIDVYDPNFSEIDRSILKHFNIRTLNDNVEGKYKVGNNDYTVFYLPHCPKQLSNNFLWRNWGLNLVQCIIIANSFNSIVENNTIRNLRNSAEYITKITPHVCEVGFANSFKYYDVFNDTAIHVFPLKTLMLIPEDFWNDNSEPNYSEIDVEYFTNACNVSNK